MESRAPTYGLAGEDQGQSAPQVARDDADHGDPDDAPVDNVRGAFEQPEIADEQGDLEEADAQLVDGPAGIVGACVRDKVGLGAQGEREAEAKLGFFGWARMRVLASRLFGPNSVVPCSLFPDRDVSKRWQHSRTMHKIE